jgi:hypothetical protein
MKTKPAIITATAAVALLLGSAASWGSDPEFHTTAGPDWTAAIGTGHATSTTAQPASGQPTSDQGSPTAAHWSALIGTGRVSGDSSPLPEVVVSAQVSTPAEADWTSKIATGHAADSHTPVQTEQLRSVSRSVGAGS